jgi:hypothetical protein
MKSLRRTLVVLLSLGFAGCGGATTQTANGGDGGGVDASADGSAPGDDAPAADATGDAPAYLACMSASGQVDASLKACQGDSDCVIKQEQTDCCGTILYVGVAAGDAASFDVCEAAWLAHFPACGCFSGQTKTEDGKTTLPGADASAPRVHCTDFTMNGGICMTYSP